MNATQGQFDNKVNTESLVNSDDISIEGEEFQSNSDEEDEVSGKSEEKVVNIKDVGSNENITKVKTTDGLQRIRNGEEKSQDKKNMELDQTLTQRENSGNPMSKADKGYAVNKSKANAVSTDDKKTSIHDTKYSTDWKETTQTMRLPGQPEKGKLPSSNLTKQSYTTSEKLKISAQKYPCYIPKPNRKVYISNLKSTLNSNTIFIG